MTSKKNRQTRKQQLPPKKRLLVFQLENCTVTPGLSRAFEQLGCKVRRVRMREEGPAGVRLIDPPDYDTLLYELLTKPCDALVLVNSKGLDNQMYILAAAELLGAPVINWYTDHPRFDPLHALFPLSEALRMLVFEPAIVEEVRRRGFRHVAALPLAADAEAARENTARPVANHAAQFECDVAFVGSLGDHRIRALREELQQGIALFDGFSLQQAEDWIARCKEWLAGRQNPALFEFFDERAEHAEFKGLPHRDGLFRLMTAIADFEITRERRIQLAKMLHGQGLKVWGDRGWEQVIAPEQYRGFVDYESVPEIYRRAKIVINHSRVQLRTAVNQRVFDVPACGGFLLTDWRPGLAEFLEPDSEVAVYRALDELPGLVERWLADDAGRAELSAKAQARILSEHTYLHRAQALLEQIEAARAELARHKLEPAVEQNLLYLTTRFEAARHFEVQNRIANLLEARGIASDYGETILALARFGLSEDGFEPQVQQLIRIARANPQNHYARLYITPLLLQVERFADVEAIYAAIPDEQRIEFDWGVLGRIYHAQNKRQRAVQCFDRVLELNPHNKTALEFFRQ